ncbi:MAG: PKD domain-containing protein [Bacteroidota bacterium]|jgi:PKD repeat protein|nr:PKD domain-containing protein [Cytophagales bacterium]MCZ8070078.1 PKD domain-containing protein [Cytophagales bacterium]
MSVRIILFVLVSLHWRAWSQPLVADFSMPSTMCLGQTINPTNQSVGASSYFWDFCDGDLGQTPTVSTLVNNSGGSSSRVEVKYSNGNYYGFFLSGGPQNLYRLNFGNSLTNTPVITSLGSLGLNSNQLRALSLASDGASFFAFIVDSQKNAVYRLDFGNSLANTPASPVKIFDSSPLNSPYGVSVVEEGAIKYLFLANNADGNLVRLTFSAGFSSSISQASAVAVSTQGIISSTFIYQNGALHCAAVVPALGQVLKVTFPNGASDLTAQVLSLNVPGPLGAELAIENGACFLFAQARNPATGIFRFDFGSSFQNAPASVQLTGLGFGTSELANISIFRSESDWIGFVAEYIGQKTYRLQFPNPCFTATPVSQVEFPELSTSLAGVFSVALTATDNLGNSAISKKSININGSNSPDIDFTSTNNCVNSGVVFSSVNVSGNITAYNWDFGDTSSATAANPVHVYSTASNYSVTLQVTAANGCQNTKRKQFQIYNPPQASFSLPPSSPFCTNQSLVFTNNSTFDSGSNPVWQWQINGIAAATTQDFSTAFATTGPQTIVLQASIPGCSTSASQSISSLVVGPLVNFNGPSVTCAQTSLSFSNSTVGSVSAYTWSFGDGNTSTSTNASNTYANIGTYQVTLQASNAAGCQNTATKSITIYSKPQPDFSIGLPPFSCAGSPSQFTDQTPAPTDSNIAAWQWAFGDPASGTTTIRNPTYTYSTAGTYNVSLTGTTNFGCTGSIQKTVTISASPQAAFTNSVACVSQPTQFTDASSGSIRSRLWTIQGNSFTMPNVQFAFVNSGSYPVLLTVTGTNNCTSQAVKNIVVPVLPTLDFSVQAACNTNPTLFTEITTGADAPLSQTWNFASLGTGTGATTQFTFSTPGNYAVQLRSTRQSGCVYSITKNVSVIQGPVADFTPSVDVGGPPLPVNFVNTSTGASGYLWRFGDTANTTSTVVSPNFTFNELGVYAVKLTASNTAGCAFTTTKPITVLVPNINVMLSDFRATPDGSGILQPTVSIVNNGNLPVSNPDLLIDVASAGLVRKKLNARILPNQTMSVPVDLQIVARSAGYICAELVVPNNNADFDKRRCLPLGSDEILFAPYPNPAADILNFDWVSTQAKPVSVIVFSPGGSEVFRQQFESIAAGLNRLQIKTTELPNGLYYILYSDGTTTKSFSFAVAKN